jgi:short-subunit dehydrogenase
MRVFISGASSGIGEALAVHYAGRGATLGLVARRSELLRSLADRLGRQAIAYSADVRDSQAMNTVAAKFLEQAGVPDIVIANAGVSHGTLAGDPDDLTTLQDTLDINVVGMAKTFQPFVASMTAARRGTLVGVASIAGIRGIPGAGAYCASKAAAISYLESLRVELRGTGVDVVALLPGFIDTPMTRGNPYPMPFILSAEDAASRFAGAIARRRPVAIIPWQMAIAARVLRWLPVSIYDRLFTGRPRKPRRGLPGI